jgi:sulfur relay (sulfurtransferase) complex TusBCD TusD component (DsrE family)
MVWTVPHTDVLLKVLGAPHHTELVTSVFRLAEALLDRGATVQVWTCGEATGLTRAGLGDSKPPDLADWTVDYPSTARLVRELLAGTPDRISWYVCRFCCADRGAADQIPEVRVRPHAQFWRHVRAADKTVVLGVC